MNGRELERTRYESEGEQLVSFAVPDAWLSTGELTRAKLRVTNPYIAEDRVKLGVMMREIGFE